MTDMKIQYERELTLSLAHCDVLGNFIGQMWRDCGVMKLVSKNP